MSSACWMTRALRRSLPLVKWLLGTGIHITKKIDKLGMRSSDTAQIFFEDVRVPKSHIIGEEGQGFTYQMLQFQEERIWGAAAGREPYFVILWNVVWGIMWLWTVVCLWGGGWDGWGQAYQMLQFQGEQIWGTAASEMSYFWIFFVRMCCEESLAWLWTAVFVDFWGWNGGCGG